MAKGVTTLVAAVVPAVDALRSQTAHAALLALQARTPTLAALDMALVLGLVLHHQPFLCLACTGEDVSCNAKIQARPPLQSPHALGCTRLSWRSLAVELTRLLRLLWRQLRGEVVR